ncbi:MAG: holo-ACP synthase [Deltaproteobacteria bacterium]|nr:holo-ACP synthase [Deltaproteobacteria bacterium]MBW2070844.1 holo-ACP synthase [Deltaproteobacteria bacterium]
MMRGLGIDMVDVGRMERAVAMWGERFLKRIFTEAEIELCLKRQRPASCLALRFAAKEAFAKALGIGLQQGLRWRDIEVSNDELGKPVLHLYDQAHRLLKTVGARKVWLSLSDETNLAVAVVVLEE